MTLFNLCFRNAVMPSKWKRLLRIVIEHFVADKPTAGDIWLNCKGFSAGYRRARILILTVHKDDRTYFWYL
jgi:hypothetical protein